MKQLFSSALMLTTLVATPAMLKVNHANALPSEAREELNLSAAQQSELDAIKENARAQVQNVLSADQLASLEGLEGRERGRAMRNLNLSEAQRAQLREIHEDSRAAANDVFTDEQQAQLQAMRAERGEGRKDRREQMAAALNLTPAQQAELDAIKENAQAEAEAVLTQEQQATLDGLTGRERGRAMRNLDLSESQRAQLQEIREASRAAADEVFTDEQRAQLQEMRANRGSRRSR